MFFAGGGHDEIKDDIQKIIDRPDSQVVDTISQKNEVAINNDALMYSKELERLVADYPNLSEVELTTIFICAIEVIGDAEIIGDQNLTKSINEHIPGARYVFYKKLLEIANLPETSPKISNIIMFAILTSVGFMASQRQQFYQNYKPNDKSQETSVTQIQSLLPQSPSHVTYSQGRLDLLTSLARKPETSNWVSDFPVGICDVDGVTLPVMASISTDAGKSILYYFYLDKYGERKIFHTRQLP